MKNIYTYGGQPAKCHLTVGCLLANKAAGKRMTQVTAFDAEEALAEIKKHTQLLLVTIGAGSAGDIILSYMSDLCGDTENPPRHAKAFGNLRAIREQLAEERSKALSGYRKAVLNHSFPDKATSVAMPTTELAKLQEELEKVQPIHQ